MAGEQIRAAPGAIAVDGGTKRGLREVHATGSVSLSPPAKYEHLTAALETAIRLLPGNDRCADCKVIYPQWAAVSFGALVCLACAGQHRSLGVSVSFVKSINMDSWSLTEQRSLEVGGNAKWAAVCTATATSDLPLAKKYTSSVADAYRSRILTAAAAMATAEPAAIAASLTATSFLATLARASTERFAADLPSPQMSPVPSACVSGARDDAPMSTAASDPLSVKCTTCQHSVALEHLDAHSTMCVVHSLPVTTWHKYECKLGASGPSLGISLTKTRDGFAEVTRVNPGGEAESLAVAVGSYVVGLNGTKTSTFDDVVALVRTLPRPIEFHFAVRRQASRSVGGGSGPAMANVTTAAPPPTISSVPEPISVAMEITFDERELGCALQVRGVGCVVQHVDHGGPAHTRGVLVGSRIVEVNGQRFAKPEDMIHAIQTSRRPMRVTFHRVEGLMRGWSHR